MITVRLGKKKVKVFNLLFLIIILCIIFYLLIALVFTLPFFKLNYKYKVNNGNYKIDALVTFKKNWFSCLVTESIKVDSNYDLVYLNYVSDLLNDGYKKVEKRTYQKSFNVNNSCTQVKEDYQKARDIKYSYLALNGKQDEMVEYGNNYVDSYVTSKINNKDVKDIEINSNYNGNKLGTYVISYSLKVDNYYTRRLYRLINVVDTVKPAIVLNGENTIILNYNEDYMEPGFIATDNYDGDITNKVKINNKINKNKPGTYKISYSVLDSSKNKTTVYRNIVVKEKDSMVSNVKPEIIQKDGVTYIDDIIIVNKDYSLPKNYDPKVNKKAYKALQKMQNDALVLGLDLSLVSGYRSYKTQEKLFQKYALKDGEEKANTYSAKPGHSEHQTGLAFDIGSVDRTFENTDEAKWIEENAYLYGFIVRYPKNKTDITGYIYEPWHVRYLGVDVATKVKASGLTLEEYLGIN